MATATNERKSKGTDQERGILNLPCEFSNVNIGDETGSVGVTVPRESLNIDAADGALCGRRLRGVIIVGSHDTEQSVMWDDIEDRIEATFDVKGFRVKPKDIGFRLTFSLGEIDPSVLSHFAKKKGRIRVDRVTELAESAKEAEVEGDEDEGDDE